MTGHQTILTFKPDHNWWQIIIYCQTAEVWSDLWCHHLHKETSVWSILHMAVYECQLIYQATWSYFSCPTLYISSIIRHLMHIVNTMPLLVKSFHFLKKLSMACRVITLIHGPIVYAIQVMLRSVLSFSW